MELQNYINILWRRKLTILLALIATVTTVVIGHKTNFTCLYLGQQFGHVLLDSLTGLTVADVAALTPNASGLILVVRQAHTQRDAIQATSNYLAGQNGKSTFLVVNQVNNANHYYYYQQREKAGSLLKKISVKRLSR